MSEIRAWVHASNDGVRPPDEHRPSARELRRFRRQIKKRLEDSGQHHAPAAGTKDGYFFVDIVGRCVSPSGHLIVRAASFDSFVPRVDVVGETSRL